MNLFVYGYIGFSLYKDMIMLLLYINISGFMIMFISWFWVGMSGITPRTQPHQPHNRTGTHKGRDVIKNFSLKTSEKTLISKKENVNRIDEFPINLLLFLVMNVIMCCVCGRNDVHSDHRYSEFETKQNQNSMLELKVVNIRLMTSKC